MNFKELNIIAEQRSQLQDLIIALIRTFEDNTTCYINDIVLEHQIDHNNDRKRTSFVNVMVGNFDEEVE